MNRLLDILCSALDAEPTSFITNLVNVTFRASMHLCSLKQDLWDMFCSRTELKDIVQRLLIDDTRAIVRKSTATTIGEKIVSSSRCAPALHESALFTNRNSILSSSVVTPAAFRNFYWALLMDLVPCALYRQSTSLEAFNLAVTISKEATPVELRAGETSQRLSEYLSEYTPAEIPGMALTLPGTAGDPVTGQSLQPGAVDLGAHGLVSLLHSLLWEDRHDVAVNALPCK